MRKVYPAHIRGIQEPPSGQKRKNGDEKEYLIQTVDEHCRETAVYAGEALKSIGLYNVAYTAGLLHDMGKYTEEFAQYIEKAASNEPVQRGTVNHTFAGVRYVLEQEHGLDLNKEKYTSGNAYKDLTAEIIAYAIGAHHGLFDLYDTSRKSGFFHRCTKKEVHYEESIENFLRYCLEEKDVKRLFESAEKEIRAFYDQKLLKIRDLARSDEAVVDVRHVEAEETCFYLGMLARMILSSVVEGDRRSTAGFMQDGYPKSFPTISVQRWIEILYGMEQRINQLPDNSPIDRARHEISIQCRNAGKMRKGIYRLNVPTGGGKTLSSLRFALSHAAEHGLKRIIFTSPLLSILDQNAEVIRDYIGDDSIVLEHHSNVIREKDYTAAKNGQEAKLDEYELLIENWESPVIITTMVQLLNTLFSGKMSSIRRFHSLCESVIVIDEVQTVPANMLTLFNLAVNFLAYACGTTVVLCSATQPCLERVAHPILYYSGALRARDLVPYDEALWKVFQRTTILDDGKMTLAEIPCRIRELMEKTGSLLVVCNKKSEAEQLFRLARKNEGAYRTFHLSAAMCMEHRKDTLNDIKKSLRELQKKSGNSKKVLVISTQVIEAGVDISFECVLRLCAGLDNIVQSAGRCNRNGERKRAPVYVLLAADENLSRLKEIQRAQDAAIDLLADYRRNPEKYRNDLSSDLAAEYYYRALYRRMEEGFQDYPVNVDERRMTLYEMLSTNSRLLPSGVGERPFGMTHQAFREAGRQFSVFGQDTETVLVPYREGKDLIISLENADLLYDHLMQEEVLEKMKGYTVSMLRWQVDTLLSQGALRYVMDERILVLRDEYYDCDTGFTTNSKEMSYWEV